MTSIAADVINVPSVVISVAQRPLLDDNKRTKVLLCPVFSCDQAALRTFLSVRLSVRHTFLTMFLPSYHQAILVITIGKSNVHAIGQGQKSKVKVTEVIANFGVSGLYFHFEFTGVYEIMHNAWSGIEEVPYCFWRPSVNFLGHTVRKIDDFGQHWASRL